MKTLERLGRSTDFSAYNLVKTLSFIQLSFLIWMMSDGTTFMSLCPGWDLTIHVRQDVLGTNWSKKRWQFIPSLLEKAWLPLVGWSNTGFSTFQCVPGCSSNNSGQEKLLCSCQGKCDLFCQMQTCHSQQHFVHPKWRPSTHDTSLMQNHKKHWSPLKEAIYYRPVI